MTTLLSRPLTLGAPGFMASTRVEDGRELLVLDLDEPQRLRGGGFVDGGHSRDLFADEADLVLGEDVPVFVGGDGPELHARACPRRSPPP